MIESKIKCDVCGADVEHVTELKMYCKSEKSMWIIPCICEGCRDAIDSALERRQRLMGCTVTPIEPMSDKIETYKDGKKIAERPRNPR